MVRLLTWLEVNEATTETFNAARSAVSIAFIWSVVSEEIWFPVSAAACFVVSATIWLVLSAETWLVDRAAMLSTNRDEILVLSAET